MEQLHGAPEDGMGSEAEGGATAAGLVMTASNIADVGQSHVPAVGASEAKPKGISTSIAEKMANLGTSSGSALNIRKKCIH